jgi:branched-subunit amino acid ABC-type transport system permease component
MERFLGDVVPGIPYGCTYALVAVGLVLTYQATGVFNFAFGAQAFMSAFVFAILTQNEGLPVWAAFLVSVVILAPAVGLVADRFLFRRIHNTNTTAKMVTSLTLLVAIPALLPVIFGNQNIYGVSPVLFNPDTVYTRLAGYPVNGDDLSAVVVTVAVLGAMVGLMRFTSLGLRMRGAVESRRLIQLDGINGDRVVAAAWAISSLLAGLAGVLLAPVYGQLQPQDYITLMVAAIAAAAWGALRSMPMAALVAVLIGVAELVLQGYLPTSSVLYTAVLPSLPFIVLVLALLFLPAIRNLERSGDPLSSIDPPAVRPVTAERTTRDDRIIMILWYGLLIAFVISMLTWIPPSWEGVFNSGLAFSVIFLSITLITGMAGQLSLAQGTLAGVGAFTAAQLAHHLGLNMLVGLVVGGLLAAAVAVVLAALSLRLVGLGLTLMTLAAAIFFDNTVFAQSSVSNGTAGLDLQQSWIRPFNLFSTNGHSYFILAMAVLVVVVLGVIQIRRGTLGLYLTAMKGSEVGAAGMGLNLSWQRLVVFALSGAIAGIGGTLLVIQQQVANPGQFNYQISIAIVVIVITLGVGTVEGAIQAGIGFVVIQQLFTYAPPRFEGLTFALFALGAATYAAHPEGIIEFLKRRATQRFQFRFHRGTPASLATSGTEGTSIGGRPPLKGRRGTW